MWKKILLIQVCICMFIISGYTAIGGSDSELLQDKRSRAVAAVSKHYTIPDLWNKGKNAVSAIKNVPIAVTNYVMNVQENQQFAEPIDTENGEKVTSVYAVSGGQVIETGENTELGKFIKIQHDGAVSIYGQCNKVYVKEGNHVRRGQVIGSYMKKENNTFYYDLIKE